jgi:hypothetical protein
MARSLMQFDIMMGKVANSDIVFCPEAASTIVLIQKERCRHTLHTHQDFVSDELERLFSKLMPCLPQALQIRVKTFAALH